MFGVSPFNVIEPFVPVQIEGLDEVVPAIFGVGFTVTITEAGLEVQVAVDAETV